MHLVSPYCPPSRTCIWSLPTAPRPEHAFGFPLLFPSRACIWSPPADPVQKIYLIPPPYCTRTEHAFGLAGPGWVRSLWEWTLALFPFPLMPFMPNHQLLASWGVSWDNLPMTHSPRGPIRLSSLSQKLMVDLA